MRVFVDANILLSAAYNRENICAALLQGGASKGLTFFICDYAIAEAQRNLQRKAPASAQERLKTLLLACQRVPTVTHGETPKGLSAKDHPIWLSAWAAGCDVLLTGDKKDFGPLKQTRLRVLSPRALFDELFTA